MKQKYLKNETMLEMFIPSLLNSPYSLFSYFTFHPARSIDIFSSPHREKQLQNCIDEGITNFMNRFLSSYANFNLSKNFDPNLKNELPLISITKATFHRIATVTEKSFYDISDIDSICTQEENLYGRN